MAIEIISEFLDCYPVESPSDDQIHLPEWQYLEWAYEGPKIKYKLGINTRTKTVAISADPGHPFGFSSLFEVAVQFDRVSIETEPMFYGDQKILVFRKDYKSHMNFKNMMVMRWPEGELSIWPNSIEVDDAAEKEYHSES